MKFTGGLLMFFSTIIIIAHTLVPHQHKSNIQNGELIINNLEETKRDGLFNTLKELISYLDLGEKHLENIDIPSDTLEIISIYYFILPSKEIPPLFLFKTKKEKVITPYVLNYKSTKRFLSHGLRAPPCA